MRFFDRLRSRFRRYPDPTDAAAVRRMTTAQWRGIAQRTPTYLEGYRDRPGSEDRAQRRAEWIAPTVGSGPWGLWPTSVILELGCGAGRNLAALHREQDRWRLLGIDICPEAVRYAQDTLTPWAHVLCVDVLAVDVLPRVDVILTCGFLGHVPPAFLPALLQRMLDAATARLVLVEEPGRGELSKGPRAWGAEKDTGPYALWRHPFDDVLASLQRTARHVPLPEDLRAPAATEMLVVERA